jgi:hypothetical protein
VEERPVILPPFQELSDATAGLNLAFSPSSDGIVQRMGHSCEAAAHTTVARYRGGAG